MPAVVQVISNLKRPQGRILGKLESALSFPLPLIAFDGDPADVEADSLALGSALVPEVNHDLFAHFVCVVDKYLNFKC